MFHLMKKEKEEEEEEEERDVVCSWRVEFIIH